MDRDFILLLFGLAFAAITFNFQNLKLMWGEIKNRKKQDSSEESPSEDES